MIEAARSRNHEVIAISSALPEIEEQVVPMYKMPSVMLPLQKKYRLALPGYYPFAKILEEFQPDILHINSPCTLGFGAARYARTFGIPVVATYHTHFPTYPRYYNLTALEPLAWKLSRALYNSVNQTFVPTPQILKELEEHNLKNLTFLPNGVDVKKFNPRFKSYEWRSRFGGGKKTYCIVCK